MSAYIQAKKTESLFSFSVNILLISLQCSGYFKSRRRFIHDGFVKLSFNLTKNIAPNTFALTPFCLQKISTEIIGGLAGSTSRGCLPRGQPCTEEFLSDLTGLDGLIDSDFSCCDDKDHCNGAAWGVPSTVSLMTGAATVLIYWWFQ